MFYAECSSMDTANNRTQWSFPNFLNRDFIQVNVIWIGYVGIADVFWNQYRLIIGDRKAHCALTVIANIASLKMYYFNKYIKTLCILLHI